MEGLLKFGASALLVYLIFIQLLLASPYRQRLTSDNLNGRPIKTYETINYRGKMTLDALGDYTPNTAVMLINGVPVRTIDAFPIDLSVCDGDILEVQLKLGTQPFYVFTSSRSDKVATDSNDSTVLVKPGINRLFKIFVAGD
ncbi:MAG: hypothetical protein N2376_02420 [Clostridia bacterium]|nr:hypothetical protein [Clostridia bacterium]